MTTTEKKLKKLAPVSKEKRDLTRKQGRCQKCLAKVPIAEQYTVTNDLKKEKVFKHRNAEVMPNKSHYCGDCADKRMKMKERWMARRAAAKK